MRKCEFKNIKIDIISYFNEKNNVIKMESLLYKLYFRYTDLKFYLQTHKNKECLFIFNLILMIFLIFFLILLINLF